MAEAGGALGCVPRERTVILGQTLVWLHLSRCCPEVQQTRLHCVLGTITNVGERILHGAWRGSQMGVDAGDKGR